MPQQSDFGFWPKVDGNVVRVSSLAEEARYGIITEETLEEIFDNRMLAADVCSRSSEPDMAFTAKIVLRTLLSIREELQGRIV